MGESGVVVLGRMGMMMSFLSGTRWLPMTKTDCSKGFRSGLRRLVVAAVDRDCVRRSVVRSNCGP